MCISAAGRAEFKEIKTFKWIIRYCQESAAWDDVGTVALAMASDTKHPDAPGNW
jgi:hypothetical protein